MATKVNISTLTPAQRKALAAKVLKLRQSGKPWDGPTGICREVGLSGAPVGRQLLREVGKADLIRKTYDHKAAAARRKAQAKPAPKRQPKVKA
jgi:hypothetical protein